jgi:trehalose/maltose hydrolase-like predicted phosphorylase
MIVEDRNSRRTKITSRRMVSMEDEHLAALQYTIQPLDYGGSISIRTGLHGDLINDGVARYRQLEQRHLEPMEEGADGQRQYLAVKTNQSGIEIGLASKIRVLLDLEEQETDMDHDTSPGRVDSVFALELDEGQALTVEKLISIYTSREAGPGRALRQAREKAGQLESFKQLKVASAEAWGEIWKRVDIRVAGDRFAQKLLRMHAYHLMVTASMHNAKLDAGIPARGLHGEAYRGHIFWDELYILNFYALHFPEIVKSVLLYRYRRIDAARKYAREHGHEGAMYPWQSGSDGREETQIVHLNPVSGEWGDDYSSLQRHVSLAIAFNIWNYYWITMDDDFMQAEGGEMILEICRFWASKAMWDAKTERYSIGKVMGPDEFHEHLPGKDEGGLKNNAYTNVMVAWLFGKVTTYLETAEEGKMDALLKKLALTGEETDRWKDIKNKLALTISDEGIIEQFDGYFGLKELDWDHYRKEYGNIHRMDRILKAEGKSPDDYKVAKQADTLMAWYNLGSKEVSSLLAAMGYDSDKAKLKPNFDYYIQRTSHGSTLSRIVHAYLANELGMKARAWTFYMEALSSDYVDIQGGTTAEGIHAGVMGATLLFVIQSIAGIDFKDKFLTVTPSLPSGWKKVSFNFAFQKKYYTFEIFLDRMVIMVNTPDDQPVEIEITGKLHRLVPGQLFEVAY